jgi:riboflavin kinase/FMN adenylyltransferase
MRIFDNLESFIPLKKEGKLVLTIGNFDGVHLGHIKILDTMRHEGGERVLLTFSNHPSVVLRHTHTKLILKTPAKLDQLSKFGIQTLLTIPFTKALSEQSAEAFLATLRYHVPFTHLVLGHDATIGKDRSGDESEIKRLAKQMNFEVKYVPHTLQDGLPISSSRIRAALQHGTLKEVEKLLGRPYSISGPVQRGAGKGRLLGFATTNLCIEELSLPPLGVYAVKIIHHHHTFKGVANLGYAPTIREHGPPLLEVHILDFDQNLYGDSIEVIFVKYLREEKKFNTLEALQNQITQDISQTLAIT